MHDDFEGRFWAENHAALSDAITSGVASLAYAFTRLTARLYDAPWERASRTRGTC